MADKLCRASSLGLGSPSARAELRRDMHVQLFLTKIVLNLPVEFAP